MQLNLPKVSIIVPVYNVEKYLDRCIQSILHQTFLDFEVILIDDGSPDNCPQMCDEYAKQDPRIRVIHQENAGQSVARNKGLDVAKGEFIAFVDSDDWIHPCFLDTLLSNALDTHADVSVCTYKEVTAKNPDDVLTKKPIKTYEGKDCVRKSLLREINCDIWLLWNKLYRRKCFQTIRLPEGRIYEDNATVYKILYESDKVAVCDQVLYYYFQNETSTVHQPFQRKHLSHLFVPFEMIAYFTKKKDMPLVEKANQIYLKELATKFQKVRKHLNCTAIEDVLKANLRIQYAQEKTKYPINMKTYPQVIEILFPRRAWIYWTWQGLKKKFGTGKQLRATDHILKRGGYMPITSIIVPVYNVESYLHQCVDSILSQSCQNIELILVDDGSKDSSPAICDEYTKKDPRVKVIHKSNSGVSSARNAGIDAATGKYIAFCDSDDYLEPCWVEELVGAISANPTAWCFCGCHTVDAVGQYVEENCVFHKEPIHEILPMSAYPEVYSANYSACLWLRIFDLDIIRANNIRFDPKLSVSEDVLFSLQYGAFCTEFSVVNLPLYNHRVYLNNEVEHLDGKLPKEMFYLNRRVYSARKVLIAEENLRSFETDFFYRFINDIKSVCRLPISVQEKKVKIREILGSKEFRCCLKNADTSKESPKLLWLLRLQFSSLIQKIFAP